MPELEVPRPVASMPFTKRKTYTRDDGVVMVEINSYLWVEEASQSGSHYCGRVGCASSGSTETSVTVSRTVPATIGGAPREMVIATEHAGQA